MVYTCNPSSQKKAKVGVRVVRTLMPEQTMSQQQTNRATNHPHKEKHPEQTKHCNNNKNLDNLKLSSCFHSDKLSPGISQAKVRLMTLRIAETIPCQALGNPAEEEKQWQEGRARTSFFQPLVHVANSRGKKRHTTICKAFHILLEGF